MKGKKYYIEAKFKRHSEANIWMTVGKTIKVSKTWLKNLLEGMLTIQQLYEILDLPEKAIVDNFKIIEKSK